MWTELANGKFSWTKEAKLLLVGLVGENIIELSKDPKAEQFQRAWTNIYGALIDAGMPRFELKLVKSVWNGLRSAALRTNRKPRRGVKLEGVKEATIGVLKLQKSIKVILMSISQ